MAATRQSVVEDFEAALEVYSKTTDPDDRFTYIIGPLMRAANRGYQVSRIEMAPKATPVKADPPVKVEEQPAEVATGALDEMTRKELLKVAKQNGFTVAVRATKAELLAAIRAGLS